MSKTTALRYVMTAGPSSFLYLPTDALERARSYTLSSSRKEMAHSYLSVNLAIIQDVEIVVQPIPRFVSNWLIGIGKLLSTLIKLKVTAFILVITSLLVTPCNLLT